MKTFASQWLGLAVVLAAGLSGWETSRADAQSFGFSYNSPGLSLGINQAPPYYGGYYPVAPVYVPRPVYVAPPVYAPRPYYYQGGYGYPGAYGPRGGYGYPGVSGYRGEYRAGYRGGYEHRRRHDDDD